MKVRWNKMGKQIGFNDNDEKLIKQIMDFQKEQNLPSFVAAVRILCSTALEMKSAFKNIK